MIRDVLDWKAVGQMNYQQPLELNPCGEWPHGEQC